VIFYFNGTLSHDEPILCEIFCELFAEQGRLLSAQEYFDEFAGLSDPEIVRAWLGRGESRDRAGALGSAPRRRLRSGRRGRGRERRKAASGRLPR
jgi:beta-phosphoglucomutase-like phosphatase (HAD superfamily)